MLHIIYRFIAIFAIVCVGQHTLALETRSLATQRWVQPDPINFPNVYAWTDTCNSYVIRDGESALLIDLGDGSLVDHLHEIGVSRIEWLLFTHHHREQCQGIAKIDRSITTVAAPFLERELFEQPANFRKWYPNLGDTYSVYGASYVRPPAIPIVLDRLLNPQDVFVWHDLEIQFVSTPGHSPGSMSYLIHDSGKTIACTGDVMHDGSKMVNWYDSEWDYGFAKGIDTLIGSVDELIKLDIDIALPSHGPTISNPREQLQSYRDKLTTFRQSYVRGYPVFDSTEQQRDSISKPTLVPLISQVTPHLYKLSHKTNGKNFAIIISDSGHGLVLDCGLFPVSMLDEIILGLREHMGLKTIDAFWISHMHGDHFLLGPTLKEKYGAEAWTLKSIVDKCENPRRYDYAALVSAYGDGFDGMKIDKAFNDGESIDWQGYTIHVDWMPGQTEFGCCFWLELDGKRIAFTGDNLFGTSTDPKQNGHEAVVARNSAILQEGYIRGSKYIKDLKPDIVMGSHSYVMQDPDAFLGRYHEWSQQMLQLYRDMLVDTDYEYQFDPYWVSAYPYRVDLSAVDKQVFTVTVRNFRETPQQHSIALKLPRGVTAHPNRLEGIVPAKSRERYDVTITINRSEVPEGVQIVPFDITLDDQHYGELFDFIIQSKP